MVDGSHGETRGGLGDDEAGAVTPRALVVVGLDAREPLGAFLQTVEIQQTADQYVDVGLYLDPGQDGAGTAGSGFGPLALPWAGSSEVELVEQELPDPGLPAPANPDALPRC